jgi:uncharacterized membrane protein YhdT
MDQRYAPQPLARWYLAAAIVSLLFMVVACAGFVMDLATDPNSLPLDQRTIVMARPPWMILAYGIAVWTGLAGTALLVIRRKLAEPLLLISFVAAIVTFIPYAAVPGIRDNISTGDIAAAIVVLAITWTIYWFARHSRQRGWLR